MRQSFNINQNWIFIKEDIGMTAASLADGQQINLPHTWNANDGQDGGNDYYRGRCWYRKELDLRDMHPDEEIWAEFRGVAMLADVYLNGQHLAHHAGGYSTFRVNLTPALAGKNTLVVSADNRFSREIYPQRADFTFYGGIYRDVHLLRVAKAHFALSRHGSAGLMVSPRIENGRAAVKVEAWLENAPFTAFVRFKIEMIDRTIVDVIDGRAETVLLIDPVHLWDGTDDPFLYTVTAELITNNGIVDEISVRFGCRTFAFDKDQGFFLNNRHYPLCGAARHQDRRGAGSALLPDMHREDMAIIREMGANTVRLAHYQHDQLFYDLADELGLIVWAEIPYITEHMPEACGNTESQLTELILQNYNHPAIVCWGLSNEITITAGVTAELFANHQRLNDLCHQLDSTRPTVMAHAFMLEFDDPLVDLPDISSYNLYFGWYLGGLEDNDAWFDEFRACHPDRTIGLSEYGADALVTVQTNQPVRGDYSEQYQAVYHEHMLRMWRQRPYIWAMHVWNMFDFAADGRDESDDPGVNHKGLVTFDRKIKKDAYYLYKAYLSPQPFVYICGRRYIDRTEELTEIKVYSNQRLIALLADGLEISSQKGEYVFSFQVPCTGEHVIEARSGLLSDTIFIRKVSVPNPAYAQQTGLVINWFDQDELPAPADCYSIRDRVSDIIQCPAGLEIMNSLNSLLRSSLGDVAKNVRMPEKLQRKMQSEPLANMLRQAGKAITPEMVQKINRQLNGIVKN